MANKAIELYGQITAAELNQYAQEGWSVFIVDGDKDLEVQRIDDVRNWQLTSAMEGIDIKIPQLSTDDEAVELARKYFVIEGYKIISKI